MNNAIRKEGSIEAIKKAIVTLNQQGKKPTQQNVAELTKGTVSISTIRRHWKDVTKKISSTIIEEQKISSKKNKSVKKISSKISSSSKKISSTSTFDKFKQRANHSTMGLLKLNPLDF